MRVPFPALLLSCAMLATACGSTVQTPGTGVGGDALGAGQPVLPRDAGLGAPVIPGTDGAPDVAGPVGGTPGSTAGGTAVGGESTSDGTKAGSAPVVGAGSSTGPVAAGKKEPIQVGYVATSVGNAAALGVNTGASFTDKQLITALVTEYNRAGGLAGHRIIPVIGETDTASSNWERDFAAVCAKFTEDNKVRAVVGYVFVFLQSFESCLARGGAAHFYGGYQPGDLSFQRQFPTLVATGHPTVDAAMLAPMVGAAQSGLLTTKRKLGLLVETCSNGRTAFEKSVEPWLKKNGIRYETAILECANGSGDVSSAAAAISSAQLKFAAADVDLVYSVGIALLVFMQQAESQGYRPDYLTNVAGQAVADNGPREQVKRLRGFGWMPTVDVSLQQQPYGKTPAQTACLEKLARQGLRPAAYNDFMAAYQACDGLDLYAKALAQGSLDAPSVVRGAYAALPSFRGAGTYDGLLRGSERQHGGAAVMREYGWTESCSCMTYRGRTYPIPTP